MLKALKFVQGAVAKKDFVPALTHFRIQNGSITGFNGTLAICSPIGLDLNVTPNAKSFIKAVQTCKGAIAMNIEASGKLQIKSGRFKVLVECLPEEEYPSVQPDGGRIELPTGILKVLKTLAPFVSEDASRSWSCGILLDGHSALATNNIVLLEYWMPEAFPVRINLPAAAIAELLRIGEEPAAMQMTETSLTFLFEDGRWLRTQTLATEWPAFTQHLDIESDPEPFPDGLFDALEDLKPFMDESSRIILEPGMVSTHASETEGAQVEVEGVLHSGCFCSKYIVPLQAIVTKIDLGMYPKPCIFFGDNLRGALIGMRV